MGCVIDVVIQVSIRVLMFLLANFWVTRRAASGVVVLALWMILLRSVLLFPVLVPGRGSGCDVDAAGAVAGGACWYRPGGAGGVPEGDAGDAGP